MPFAIAIDPTGTFAYVTNEYANNVSTYNVNPTSGALTQVQGSPFATGENPWAIATCKVVKNACVPPPL